MRVAGLVVAGGAGERMWRSGSTVPKPLVKVRGVTLLERNVFSLLRAGITDIHVAVSAKAESVLKFAQSHCHKMAKALHATLSVIEESQPLGSIGPAGLLRDRGAVLVVNADNLTCLDLRAVLAVHRGSDAALTLAVHDQPLTIPFGEVSVETDRIVAYREKPTVVISICSAVSVLGKVALDGLQPGENVGLPVITNRLLAIGAHVRAFRHNAPWIDVNDLAAAERAEALVTAHAAEFELWAGQPDSERVVVVFASCRGVVLEQLQDGSWSLPTARILTNEDPVPVAMRIITDRLGVPARSPSPLTVFDDVDTTNGGVIRTHVFLADVTDGAPPTNARWIRSEEVRNLDDVARLVFRALPAWTRN